VVLNDRLTVEGHRVECGPRGAPEVLIFHPFSVRQGPVMLVGDACPSCALTLGIRQEVSA